MEIKKLNLESDNIIQNNIEQLKQLFPEIVTEEKIDFYKLKEILGDQIDDNDEKYEFTWHGKHDAIREFQKPSKKTLRPCKEESKNWDETQNLYIEGDNLDVLKILQKSYQGKIKMMYIDPPYNTGNDSFVYKDDFKDTEEEYNEKEENKGIFQSNSVSSGRYHTNWLNMMYPRLRLARNLLTEEGVIFISIDDKELFNLKKICDEIFGENNFIASFPRITKKSGKSSEDIAKNHDYILFYSKTSNKILYPFEHIDKNFKYSDEYEDKRGKFKLNQTLDYDTLGYINTLDFPITIGDETFYPGNVTYEEFKNRKKENPQDGYRWRWSEDLVKFGMENDFIVVKKYDNYSRLYTKTYANAKIEKNNGKYEIKYIKRTKPLSTLNFVDNKYSNDNSKKNIDKILGKNIFDYSKPVTLIETLLNFSSKDNDIILDFFSGSSTTAEAVFKFNSYHNVNNKFIMVQLPEKTDEKSTAFKEGYFNICEIGKERIRKSGENILKENPNIDIDTGFKVLKVDSSNFKEWDPKDSPLEDYINENIINIKSDRSELDLVFEIMLKYGLELTSPIEKVQKQNYTFYSIGFGALIICLDDNVDEDVSDEIIDIINENFEILGKNNEHKNRVVFKDNSFLNDSVKTNIIQVLENNDIEDIKTY